MLALRACRAANGFCNDWLLRGYERTFSPFHHRVITAYALKVGTAGQGDNRDPSFSAFGAVRYPIHEIPPNFLPITRNGNFRSIRAFWARTECLSLALGKPLVRFGRWGVYRTVRKTAGPPDCESSGPVVVDVLLSQPSGVSRRRRIRFR